MSSPGVLTLQLQEEGNMQDTEQTLFEQEWNKIGIEPLYAEEEHWGVLVRMAEEYATEDAAVAWEETDRTNAIARESARRAAHAFAILCYGAEAMDEREWSRK